MLRNQLPNPEIIIDMQHARRFLLAHQQLYPPRSLEGKEGIIEYIKRVSCIQFDPVNLVGRNPELVLQSRISDFKPGMLEELLYSERILIDGWDKVSSIHLANDWPYFTRHRQYMRERHGSEGNLPMQIVKMVTSSIRDRGPLSSIDFQHNQMIDWSWGQPARQVRSTLEVLYAMGELGIHRRLGTRRYFDLIENLLPADLLNAADPNPDLTTYQDWHVLRRVGAIGLANPSATEAWLGIFKTKSAERRAALIRLVESGKLVALSLEGLPDRVFFIRRVDLPLLERNKKPQPIDARVAIIAPLDNLTWDRELLRWVFDFDYAWEIYKPAAQRKYGAYVLPVLYGESFVARLNPKFDTKSRCLTIKGWWWEAGIQPDERMRSALMEGMTAFFSYLEATKLTLEKPINTEKSLEWLHRLPI